MLSIPRSLILTLAATSLHAGASAQCAFDWAPGSSFPIGNGTVLDLETFDDGQGSGPALFAAGSFVGLGIGAKCIVRWNGAQWSPLGSGLAWANSSSPDPLVADALTVWDDGSGPALYVAGSFDRAGGVPVKHIARWDGASWSTVGAGITQGYFGLAALVNALAVFDDGSGEALYAGGSFTGAGGNPANFVARWDGTSWTNVASGIDGPVRALLVHDDGSGPRLYAGGNFPSAGGVTTSFIARWDGSAWGPVGLGTSGEVWSLAVYDEGTGPMLYAGGAFVQAGGVNANRIARWDGTDWTRLDAGLSGTVYSLGTHMLGGQPRLVAGGTFAEADGQPVANIAAWDGDTWSALGSGVAGPVIALKVFDEQQGLGPALFAGGAFDFAGGVFSPRLARWQPSSGWSVPLQGQGFDGGVRALAEADDGSGSGSALFAGGTFTRGGTVAAARVAKRTSSGWQPLGAGVSGTPGSGTPSVEALVEFDDGNGPALYVGGYYSTASNVAGTKCIARWKNGVWSSIGGVDDINGVSQVSALAVHDDGSGPALYAGGRFNSAGGVPAANVSRWDGTSWIAMPGLGTTASLAVLSLAVFDDGSGPKLYAGGNFNMGNLLQPDGISVWDGTSWSPIGAASGGTVRALTVFDYGGGPSLYVAGNFLVSGTGSGVAAASWNGFVWTPVADDWGLNESGYALSVFDEGAGPRLYLGGAFSPLNGAPSANIASWDGAVWSALSSGTSSTVRALHASGDELLAGGDFGSAGGVASNGIATWREVCDWTTVCSGDGTSGPCPCANVGGPGRGCANSAEPAGAELAASGTTTPDALVLATNGTGDSVLTIFFKGNSLAAPTVFGDGLRCAGGQLIRFGAQNAVAGSASYPGVGQTPLSDVGNTPSGSGLTAVYQAFFRDPTAGFCTSATFNGTNGLRVVW